MSKQVRPENRPAAGPVMNVVAVYTLAGGLAAGGLVGFLIGRQTHSGSAPVPAVTAAPPPTGAAPPPTSGAHMPPPQLVQQIAQLEMMTLQDPKNHDAWADLGNLYFDSHQHSKAIEAYGKALALKPNNPNILTDQGVMYRDTGQFDKAIANFLQASKIDPKHVQSLFNLGVVYANDVNKPAEAEKAWKKVVEAAPGSPHAAQARQALEQLKARK